MNNGMTEKWRSQTYGIAQTLKTLKYLSLMALLDLSWIAEFFTKLSLVTLKNSSTCLFKVFDKFC